MSRCQYDILKRKYISISVKSSYIIICIDFKVNKFLREMNFATGGNDLFSHQCDYLRQLVGSNMRMALN